MRDQPKSTGISLSELSRRLGRSRAALRKLARAGTIPCNRDGTFDEATVRYAYGRNTHPAWRKPLKPAEGLSAAGLPPPGAGDLRDYPVTFIRRVLAEEGRPVVGPVTHDDARAAEVIFRCRKIALEIAAFELEYIPREPLQRHVEEAFNALRADLAAVPSRYAPRIAQEVGCDVPAATKALGRMMAAVIHEMSPPFDFGRFGRVSAARDSKANRVEAR